MVDLNWDKVVRVHQKINQEYKAKKQEWEDVEAGYKDKLEQLQNFLLHAMNEGGVASIRTASGTVYRKEKTIPQASDWEAFYAWVKKHDAFDALEKRIKATFITQYMEEHGDELPPGVSVFTKYEVGVRKA